MLWTDPHSLNQPDNSYICRLRLSDAQAYFDCLNQHRTYFQNWLPWLESVQTIEDVQRFIVESHTVSESGPHGYICGLFHENQLVGSLGLNPIWWPQRQAYLGYWLIPHYEGRGWMTEASQYLIHWGAQNLGLKTIYAEAPSQNYQSLQVLERLGFESLGESKYVLDANPVDQL